jgi:lipid II:glycine glycyltransferase (peptidoglycan interpeptide bridge formation enzyme)
MNWIRRAVTRQDEWDSALVSLPQPHILQSWEWGEVKSKYGWEAERWIWEENGKAAAAAQILERRWPAGLPWPSWRVLYVPRGPILDWSNPALASAVLADLTSLARERQAIFIKIDPELPLRLSPFSDAEPDPPAVGAAIEEALRRSGWIPSLEQIQFRSTLRLGLESDEDELLARMKSKTRYNIRLAERKGVSVRPGSERDFDEMYALYRETSIRDGFVIRPRAYYLDAWGTPLRAGKARIFLAEVQGRAVAALILFHFGPTAWYFYGMSTSAHRESMPTHLLQWEAIRWAKAAGIRTYDFWGAPDRPFPEDPMFGVYRFKAGFGASWVQTLGAWDLPVRRSAYQLYAVVLPRVLAILRRRQRRQSRLDVEGASGEPASAGADVE